MRRGRCSGRQLRSNWLGRRRADEPPKKRLSDPERVLELLSPRISSISWLMLDPAAKQHDQRTQLTNRSAWLSLAAALFFFVGLLTFGTTVQKTEDLAVRAASGAPFAVAFGSAMWARSNRAKLRALVRRDDSAAEMTGGGPAVTDEQSAASAIDHSSPGQPPTSRS
jgi:hypothetical protein